MYAGRDITVIIPALNEAPSIVRVVEELAELRTCPQCNQLASPTNSTQATISTDAMYCTHVECCTDDSRVALQTAARPETLTEPLIDRIIVCDNGSSDNTASLAAASGAIVTYEPFKGYGAACLAALAVEVEKDIIVFVDGDHSVVATELPDIINPLLHGADLVIGSRTLGHTEKGALSIPQQFGNTLASFLISKIWSASVTDLGPFRATTQQTMNDLQMTDKRFGWTVEMQVRALQENKTVTEVPVSTLRRIGKSKVSGTVLGVIGAAHGILGTIFKLYLLGTKLNAAANHHTTAKHRQGEN